MLLRDRFYLSLTEIERKEMYDLWIKVHKYHTRDVMRLRTFRKLREIEYDRLPIFMYNAVIQPEDKLYETDVVYEDRYHKYIKDFGKEDDFALVCDDDGRVSGIIWTRLFKESDKSFGFVDEETPELTLSVLAGYNEQSIGKELLELLFNELKIRGYKQVSVSIGEDNEIFDVYTLVGFEEVECKNCGDDKRVTLLKKL